MSIVKEFYKTRNDGINLFKTFSDENKYIVQKDTGIRYSVAIDVENSPHEYEETEEAIKNAEY